MDSRASRFDYVTVGHVTRDVIEDRAGDAVAQPGGGAFYSALQASRLGLRTSIVTQGVPREIEALLEPYIGELDLQVIPAKHTTTLSTRGAGEKRSQRLLAWAGPIVEPLTLDADILHVAPVARETPLHWQGQARFVGLTPQGLVRHWEQGDGVPLVQLDTGSLLGDVPLSIGAGVALAGDISPVELDPSALPERFDAAVISEHECQSCHPLFAAARDCGAYVAVTAGSRPATVHLPDPTGGSVVQTALPRLVRLRDDLGAGDVFAAAFFVALSEGRDPLEAATFGNAAAAVRISGVGPDSIASRAAITP
ncbi:MAG TPA: PfkB family carbohydrate kinase [Solirubrobacteraceae bacterium]|jgi:sugar/nucleoside kinase (ribokinase family)|nr:PfkB family carbohydrate kinase [Solirubrobacteraceae bacterium]